MTGEGDGPQEATPAQRRVQSLLESLREGAPSAGTALTRRVVSMARWQRPVRHALQIAGRLAGALGDGLRVLLGQRRPR